MNNSTIISSPPGSRLVVTYVDWTSGPERGGDSIRDQILLTSCVQSHPGTVRRYQIRASFMMMRLLCACSIVVAISALGCTTNTSGVKILNYGNMKFYVSTECRSVSIHSVPWPQDVAVILSDGIRIDGELITSQELDKLLGPPVEDFHDERIGRFVKYQKAEARVAFKKDAFFSFDADSGASVMNLKNEKSVTLPTTEAKIREVFGEPTAISNLTRPSP